MKKNATATAPKTKTAKAKSTKKNEVSYHRRPDNLQLDAWQFALRKQFGEKNPFEITNTGSHPVFSDFNVHNPASKNDYRVAIRSGEARFGKIARPTLTNGGNFCSCQDFKTNRLGLCKHISAVLATLAAVRGNKKWLKSQFRQPHSSIYLAYRDGREIRLSIGTEKEAELRVWAVRYFDAEGRMRAGAFPKFVDIIAEARAIEPEFRCYPDAFEFILNQRDQMWREAQLSERLPAGVDDRYFDNLLKVNLFPYQKTGVLFAARAGRCLLADEMGLGKTIQAIAAAELYRREFGIQRVLVVCPTTLKYQWKSEIEKFADGASVEVIEGLNIWRKKKYAKSEAFFQIVSYNTVVYDIAEISREDYDLVILDEAQRIKNFRTKVAAELKKIYSPYCIVLTGTPLENKLEELYSITQFIDQYKLPPLYRFLDRYQIQNETGKVTGFRNLKEIGQLLGGSLLRRTKKEVWAEMPKRMDKNLFVPMTKEQADIHRDLADAVARLVLKWQRYNYLSETDRRRLILSLSQMRMVCDSTFILDQRTRHDTKIAELMCILEEALADAEQKVVIFSSWERMTRLVAQECTERGIGFANLHGGIESKARGALIERFRDDPECRIFLSTDAGGVGLNLQKASLLINLDIPWNPAVLEQRIGRIYRLGQERNITVINMVALQTIEHRMLGVLEFKADMAKGVLDPEGEDVIFMSESRFKKFMQNVESLAGGGSGTGEAPSEAEMGDLETGEAPRVLPRADFVEEEEMETPAPKPAAEIPPKREKAPSENPGVLQQPNFADVPGEKTLPETPGVSSASNFPETPGREEPKTLSGDDVLMTPPPVRERRPAAAPSTPQELVQTGVSFFAGLAETLASLEKTQALVNSIVQKDEATGQTFLRIPVENQAVVENAVRMFGSLFASFAGK